MLMFKKRAKVYKASFEARLVLVSNVIVVGIGVDLYRVVLFERLIYPLLARCLDTIKAK